MSRRARVAGRHRRVQFGFNSGVGPAGTEVDITKFKADIDLMAANGCQWVRFGIAPNEVTSGGTPTSVTPNEAGLAMNDEAIDYARSKGINLYLNISKPDSYADGYTFANFRTALNAYWSLLINRWGGKVAVWQLFNESNGSDYQTGESIPLGTHTPGSPYLTQLATLLSDGRALVKAANPGALVTTDAEGFPVDDEMQTEWEVYFDMLAAHLDIIGLHMYPVDNAAAIATVSDRITAMRTRYGKPVAYSEFGIPTASGGDYTEGDQQTFLPQQIAEAKAGLGKIIMPYEFRDQSATITDPEMAYGIRRNNGTNKSGYTAIMNAMR